MSKDKLSIHNPHDHLFKEMFSDLQKVKSYLEGTLAAGLLKRLDLDSLEEDPNTYIDDELKGFYSDVVYNCRYKGNISVKITLLFEHKSYVPKYPHIQLLIYMVGIWRRQIKEGESISLIIPMVIYHGKNKWTYRSFDSYFEGEIDEYLLSFIPMFDFLLTNLKADSVGDIRRRFKLLSLQMGFLLMKSISEDSLLDQFEEVFQGADELIKNERGRKYFELLIVYLYYGSKLDTKEIMEKAYHISQQAGELADSTAMRLIQQGRAEGRSEGRTEGIKEGEKRGERKGEKIGEQKKAVLSCVEMLKSELFQKGLLSYQNIAAFTGLSIKGVKKIHQKLDGK